jgi:flagellar biogenesis protein FliO
MTRIALAGMVFTLLCAVTGSAHANRLKVDSYKFDDGTGVVELSSKGVLGEPWMRFEHGEVRIWFPDIEDISRFDHNDGEHAIHSVRLRYGSDNTAVLKIDLSDRRTLRKDDIEVMRNGPHATITIRTEPKEPVKAQEPAAATQAPLALKAAPPPFAQKPAPLQGSAYLQALSTGVRSPTLPAAKAAHKPLKFSADHNTLSSGMGALLLTALALGVIYGFIHFGTRRKSPLAKQSQIEVLSSKRIGHRHQLVLVRALGQDHLLSLHGGRAECLSSVAAGTAMPDQPSLEPRDSDDTSGKGRGIAMFNPFLSKRRPWESVLEEGINTPSKNKSKSEAPPFGDELLNFVRTQQSRRSTPAMASATGAPGVSTSFSSEAVAGIARLRARAMS